LHLAGVSMPGTGRAVAVGTIAPMPYRRQHRDGKERATPGDPYEVGFGKPPKRTRFKKGHSGNPKGRPRKKPDLYSELTKVLREKVTVEGQQERVTVQQALSLRLRDQALRGELWAQKLIQKVVGALPESGSERAPVDMRAVAARFDLLMKEAAREKTQAEQAPEKAEALPHSVEPENDE
jgi:nucleoid-associated protein YgaU